MIETKKKGNKGERDKRGRGVKCEKLIMFPITSSQFHFKNLFFFFIIIIWSWGLEGEEASVCESKCGGGRLIRKATCV